jgi:hypothetical protein
MIALLQEGLKAGSAFRIPAGVLAQAWRDGTRQVALTRLIRAPEVDIEALDESMARACGELCSLRGSSDIVDASVVLVARKYGDVIVSGDAADLQKLDPHATIQKV